MGDWWSLSDWWVGDGGQWVISGWMGDWWVDG